MRSVKFWIAIVRLKEIMEGFRDYGDELSEYMEGVALYRAPNLIYRSSLYGFL
jgi:hypothetical protein